MQTQPLAIASLENQAELSSISSIQTLEMFVPEGARSHLVRMFRDPRVLGSEERAELVQQLREAVATEPKIAGLRVLLGMALCVNLEVQEAMEELRDAVRLAPDSFIARLKLGELLMRLRICTEAAEQTQAAAELADSDIQAELARRQATAIRTMLREGVERGRAHKMTSALGRATRWFSRSPSSQSEVALTSR